VGGETIDDGRIFVPTEMLVGAEVDDPVLAVAEVNPLPPREGNLDLAGAEVDDLTGEGNLELGGVQGLFEFES